MTKSLQDLRELRAARTKTLRDHMDKHPAGKWTPEAQAEFDRLEGEVTSLDGQIKAMTRAVELEAEEKIEDKIRDADARRVRDLAPTDPRRIFDIWMRDGDGALNAEQWVVVRNTMSTTTGSEGGFTVPSLIASSLIDIMKAYGTMRAVSDVIATADGKPLSYPTSDGTSETGEWVAQNASATAADPTFGTVSLNVFKASSKIVAVPIELLQDSTINIEQFVNQRLATRLGRLTNTGFTVGTGTTQPDGVIPRATVGKVGATGQTLTIIYDDLVDLVHSIDPAYRGSRCSWQTNDTMLRVLRKLKDTSGRPIWMPSYDQGIRMAVNNPTTGAEGHGGFATQSTPQVFDYLLGYPLWVNNDIAVPAANAKSLAFGDFSYYKIRDALDVQMFRFTDSAYIKLGQVGFLAWMRTGGNLVDVNAVKVYQHSAT